mmetsp:Transcript_15897/g.30471  ORF Transcript_15897/g.30471 Transcript_15897/m.30471 type:complete len:472 (+) Transcript_15897:292-1707(+)
MAQMRSSGVDTDSIIANAEAQLAVMGRPRTHLRSVANGMESDYVRTIVISLAFCVCVLLVTLPQVHFGGFTETVKTSDDIPKGPPFGYGCDKHGRGVRSPWPLTSERHIRSTWIAKSEMETPMQYVHMAMLDILPNGTLVSAFQASTGLEGAGDQHIRLAFAKDVGGLQWGGSFALPFPRNAAQWSPVLHVDAKGRIWIFYTEGTVCKYSHRDPELWNPGGDIKVAMWTPRNGGTWKSPRVIYPQTADRGLPKVLANKLVVLATGEWVLPFWSEKHSSGTCDFAEDAEGSAGILISKDQGWSWERRGYISSAQTWLIEGSVVQTNDKNLMMYFRSLKGVIYQAISSNLGHSWSLPEATTLANPDSKVHILKLGDGMVALAYNNHPKLPPPFRRTRTNLDISVTRNQGKSWTRMARLEDAEQAGLRNHYPTMMQVGCTLFVAYSRFFHEEYMYEAKNTTMDLGIRLLALDLR